MIKFLQSNKFFLITSRAPKYVLFLFIVVLSIGLAEALVLSPEDYKQSHCENNVRSCSSCMVISGNIFNNFNFIFLHFYF